MHLDHSVPKVKGSTKGIRTRGQHAARGRRRAFGGCGGGGLFSTCGRRQAHGQCVDCADAGGADHMAGGKHKTDIVQNRS